MTSSDAVEPEPSFARYAIYYAPEPGSPLAHFGRTWFGYDAEAGVAVANRQDYGLGPDFVARVTATPRRYGLHGTLRAPFRLAPGIRPDELIDALAAFAATRPAVSAGEVGLSRLGRFLALTPLGKTQDIDRLHTQCIFAFDRFRAPLSAAERTRRQTPGLTANQRVLLAQWGYPFVLSEYRFHISLTGPLSAHECERITPVLIPALKDLQGEKLHIGAICLFAEPSNGGAFRLVARVPLAG
ncbi:MAG: DUF1045 domain-containing protein [Methyloligellaceae bacterium]